MSLYLLGKIKKKNTFTFTFTFIQIFSQHIKNILMILFNKDKSRSESILLIIQKGVFVVTKILQNLIRNFLFF